MRRLNFCFVLGLIVMMVTPSYGQRYEVSCVRKKAVYENCATIVFNSTAQDLNVVSVGGDTLLYQNYDGVDTWKMHVDLNKERVYGDMGKLNRSFILHTPYMEDSIIAVPGKYMNLNQSTYLYKISVIDYFPYKTSFELPLLPEWCFGVRVAAGRRLGAYVSFKLGLYDADGYNADAYPDLIDIGKLKYEGKICKSFTCGLRYGIINRHMPIYGYLGLGYGEAGYAYSNGQKGKKREKYYSNYTKGVQGEIGLSMGLFDFLSVSLGVESVFGGERVMTRFSLSLGFCINPNE